MRKNRSHWNAKKRYQSVFHGWQTGESGEHMRNIVHLFLALLCIALALMPTNADEPSKNLIMSKTADSITLVDEVGRTVTVDLPVKKIVSSDYRAMEALLAIGAKDMIIGVDSNFHKQMPYYGLKDVSEVGIHAQEVNYEQILSLQPDIVIVPLSQGASADEISSKLKGVPVIVMSISAREVMIPQLEIMGQLLGKEVEAGKLIIWTKKYDNIVEERLKDLKKEDMPTFYYESMTDLGKKWLAITPRDYKAGRASEGCGGRNIAADIVINATSAQEDAEWVLSKDPDYIILDCMGGEMAGPGKTESDVQNNLTKIIESRASEGFENLTAVKNGHIYVLSRDFISGPRWAIGHICIAKWFHPDLFRDLSPEEINKEYLKEFQGIELEGTWAYPAAK